MSSKESESLNNVAKNVRSLNDPLKLMQMDSILVLLRVMLLFTLIKFKLIRYFKKNFRITYAPEMPCISKEMSLLKPHWYPVQNYYLCNVLKS